MIPKSKEYLNNLIDYINDILNGQVDEIDFDFLDTEAQKLEARDYADYKCALGMVASLRGNFHDVKRNFHAAHMASGQHDPIIGERYAAAMANTQRMGLAMEIISRTAEDHPDNISVLRAALDTHLTGYDTQKAKEYVSRLSALGVELDENIEPRIHAIENLVKGSGGSPKLLCDRMELVYQTLFDAGFLSRGFREVHHPEGLIVEIEIQGDVDRAIAAEQLLLNKIASLPYSPIDSVLSFVCAPYERTAN